MLFWLFLSVLLIGSIVYTISYALGRYNILDTVKAALNQAATSAAKKALASNIKAMVKEKKPDAVKVEVLVARTEKLEVTINCSEVKQDVYEGMVF